MAPLFVFTADLHLEDGAWSTRPSIYGDAYYSFAQIVDYCIANTLPLVLGGDVLEKKSNAARPIAKLCDGLSRMQAAGLKVSYSQGNHEYDRNAPWLSVHPWPVHMHTLSVEISGCLVHGLDWLPRGEIQEAFKNVPEGTDILITHQVWEDFMKGLGRTECTLADVHNVQTILAGDFHVTATVDGVNANGQPIEMLSPGSICMQDLGESPDKWFFVICAQPGARFHFERKALQTRPFAKYTVADQEYLDQLCAGALSADISHLVAQTTPEMRVAGIDKPIVRIKFDKSLPDAFLRLTTAVGDSAHLFCEALADKPGAQQTKNHNRDGAKNDLLSALSDLLGADSAEYKLAEKLVQAEDPSKELEAFFKAFFTEEVPHAVVETGSPELGAPSPPSV